AEAQNVENQRLVVAFPAKTQETALRPPAMAEGRAAVQRPAPVDTPVERIGKAADFGLRLVVMAEILPGGQHAGHQKGRVDSGKLAFPSAPAGLHVEEMVEEALVAGG